MSKFTKYLIWFALGAMVGTGMSEYRAWSYWQGECEVRLAERDKLQEQVEKASEMALATRVNEQWKLERKHGSQDPDL
jgi:hypothetical protein